MGLFDYEQENINEEELKNAELVNRESFERLQGKNRSKNILRKIGYVALAVFLLSFVAVICFSVFFNLKTITIEGNSRYSDEEIIESSGLSLGSNLFLISDKSVKNEITENLPYVENVSISRVWPTGLKITVVEDDAMWYSQIWGEWFVLSGELKAMERVETFDEQAMIDRGLKRLKLPEIDRIITGETVVTNKTTALPYTLSFLNELRGFDFFASLEYIDCSDRYHIAVYFNQGRYQILLGESKNIEAKLKLVEIIMENEDAAITATDIVSFNAESVSPVIVRKQSDIFVYD